MQGVAIKVKIGLKPNGYADYPDWTTMPLASGGSNMAAREALVRAHQIVRWVYDQCGHEEELPDSPRGMQWGMMIVTQQFADEAKAIWPDRIIVLTEAEAQDFWENRCHQHLPALRVDNDILSGLKTMRDLYVARGNALAITALDARIDKALDPDDPEPGVAREPRKRWATAKTAMGFSVKAT